MDKFICYMKNTSPKYNALPKYDVSNLAQLKLRFEMQSLIGMTFEKLGVTTPKLES